MVVAGSKLGVWKNVVGVGVGEDPFGDDFFKELPAAFEEADGAICFRETVIGFVGFGDYDNQSVFPGVVPEGYGCVVDRRKSIWSSLKCPLKECIIDPRGARGRLVRGWRDGSRNLFLGNRRKVADREGWGIIGLDGCDLGTIHNEKLLLECNAHLSGVVGKGHAGGEERGEPWGVP